MAKKDELDKLEARLANITNKANDALDALYDEQIKQVPNVQEINRLTKEHNDLLNTTIQLESRINKLQEDNFSTADSLQESFKKQLDYLKSNNKELTKEQKQLQKHLETNRINADTEEKILQALIQQEDEYKSLNSEALTLNQKIRQQREIWEAAKQSADGFLNDVTQGIAKLPIIGDSLSKGFDKFIKSEAGKKVRKKLAKAMFDQKTVGKSLSGALGLGMATAGIGLIGAGVSATLSREQELKDQQRSIGLTNDESKAVDSMQRGLLNSFGTMVTSMEEARKASAELVEDFGKYGADNKTLVDQQVKLTKAYGLQAEDASNFQRTAKIAGKDTAVVKKEVFAIASGFNKATGSTQSLSAVLRSVSKLSDAIRVQFRGSDKELTNAVMKAKMLGTSLEDLNGIADQLLNIESSIENQVTAQLVTGRNINLEKARYFALNDDMSGLMDELVKQEITFASYTKMNRVEKQATAAALGMNTEQMAKFVSQQELAKQLGIDMSKAENQTAVGLEESLKARQKDIELRAKLGDEAAKQYIRDNESLTAQEKMNKLVDIMLTTFKFFAPVLI